MQTQCPNCKKTYAITADDLRNSSAIILCDGCKTKFDALELLQDEPVIENQPSHEPFTIDDDFSEPVAISKPSPIIWTTGFCFCLLCLCFQIYFFEGYRLSQNVHLRPWLEKICQQFNCELPQYKNLDEFSILHGSFTAASNRYYVFETAFINQANFEQNYPSIKLTLLDFTGGIFAERTFRPQEYSPQQTNHRLQADMSAEISMNIAMPSSNIGGYRFELI